MILPKNETNLAEENKSGSGCMFLHPLHEFTEVYTTLFLRNDVVAHLGTIDDMAQHIPTMIPMQVLADIDNSRNPMQLTKERLERTATENQFMNGKIAAIQVRSYSSSYGK